MNIYFTYLKMSNGTGNRPGHVATAQLIDSPNTGGPSNQFLITKADKLVRLRAQFNHFASGMTELKQELGIHDTECVQELERLNADVLKLFCSRGPVVDASEESERSVRPKTSRVMSNVEQDSVSESEDEQCGLRGSKTESPGIKMGPQGIKAEPRGIKTEARGNPPETKNSVRNPSSSQGATTAAPTMDSLIQALSRLDVRRAPRPSKFEVTSGRTLDSFLAEFEEYCENSFRGCSSMWSSELEQFLSGSILQAYLALHVPGESYNRVKVKLLEWSQEHKSSVAEKVRRRFEKSRINPGEPLRLYAARLEKEFSLAYPSKKVTSSQTLLRKFLTVVPKAFQKHVSSIKSFLSMQGLQLDWTNILSLASGYDAENLAMDSCVESEMEQSEVWVSSVPTVDKTNKPEGKISTQIFESKSCHFCKKKGHVKNNCWLFNNKCLSCGSGDHKVSSCPRKSDNSKSSVRSKGEGPGNKVCFQTSCTCTCNCKNNSEN